MVGLQLPRKERSQSSICPPQVSKLSARAPSHLIVRNSGGRYSLVTYTRKRGVGLARDCGAGSAIKVTKLQDVVMWTPQGVGGLDVKGAGACTADAEPARIFAAGRPRQALRSLAMGPNLERNDLNSGSPGTAPSMAKATRSPGCRAEAAALSRLQLGHILIIP